MTNEFIFAQALNIQDPCYVKNIEFKKEEGELHIYVDFKKGETFDCPVCNTPGMPVYDTEEKTWRHLDFFQFKAFIHFRTPRITCPDHKTHIINVSWGRPGSGFTLLMEAMIIELAKYMPVSEIAHRIGENDTRVWRVIKKNVRNARAREDYSSVSSVGMDETSSKKGHKYISIFVNMDTKKVLFATEGKDSSTLTRFKEDLEQHSGVAHNVKNFSIDMSPAFIKGIEEDFEKSIITFDKFHVIKIINEAVDKTRRAEQKDNDILKHTRYSWLKNPNNLTNNQSKVLETLSKMNLKTGKAYRIKLALQEIYNSAVDKNDALVKLNSWLSWASRCRIEHIKDAAKTVKAHLEGILNYFDTRLTNGILEGINGLVQAARARARGFRNTDNFIDMVYLIGAKLDFKFNI
jgi:transposase